MEENQPPEYCDACGMKNPERLAVCSHCGGSTAPLAPPAPQRKSVLLAVVLALIFGPLGLLYLRAWKTAAALILVAFPFLISGTGTTWVMDGGRVVCAALAFFLAREQDERPNERRDALRLLDAAARLENKDPQQAIGVYEEVIQRYPGSKAAKEAARNIEILGKRN